MQCIRLSTLLLISTFVVGHRITVISFLFPPDSLHSIPYLRYLPASTLAVLGLDGNNSGWDVLGYSLPSALIRPAVGILSGSGVRCADFHPGQDILPLFFLLIHAILIGGIKNYSSSSSSSYRM